MLNWHFAIKNQLAVGMRTSLLIISVAVFFAASGLHAECEDAPKEAKTYVHKHKVYHFNGEDPSWEEDVLQIWTSASETRCFSVDTWGPNWHECGAHGVLEPISSNQYRFSAEECSIRLTENRRGIRLMAGKEWRRLGAGGSCPQRYSCGMYGSIESGNFLPR